MSVELTNTTMQRFNSLFLHDSKRVSVSVFRVQEDDRVKLSLELLGKDGSLTPAQIVFHGCAYVQTDLNLAARLMCSDDISNAKCYESSDWKAMVSEPSPYDPIQGGRGFEKLLHFSVSMCPPSGSINILARDFSLESSK